GEFCDALLHPKRSVPKVYVVKVAGEMRETDRRKWAEGVDIGDEMDGVGRPSDARREGASPFSSAPLGGAGHPRRAVTGPAEVRILRHEGGKTWLEVTMAEGRNQQIRRMGEATGFPVMRLSRTSFAGIQSDGLKPGAYRALTLEELRDLRAVFGVPRHLPRAEGSRPSHLPRGESGRPRHLPRAEGSRPSHLPRADGAAQAPKPKA